jgi:hypothetical protein
MTAPRRWFYGNRWAKAVVRQAKQYERDGKMRSFRKIMTTAALAATAATAIAVPADARTRHRHHYYGRT